MEERTIVVAIRGVLHVVQEVLDRERHGIVEEFEHDLPGLKTGRLRIDVEVREELDFRTIGACGVSVIHEPQVDRSARESASDDVRQWIDERRGSDAAFEGFEKRMSIHGMIRGFRPFQENPMPVPLACGGLRSQRRTFRRWESRLKREK